MRYIRAFFTALRMTARGEQITISSLEQWMQESARLVDSIYATANRAGIDQAARKQITLQIDRRMMTAETILATIKHHVVTEYPYLLRDNLEHGKTAIYASNLNDRYFVMRLAEAESIKGSPFQQAVVRLRDHLDAIPPSDQ